MWLTLRPSSQERRAVASGAASKDDANEQGFVKAYLETILGNLQLSITAVHVRFEGDLPGAAAGGAAARFAAGITLQELSATTTDASGAEAFEAKAREMKACALHLCRTHAKCDDVRRGLLRDCTSARYSSGWRCTTTPGCVVAELASNSQRARLTLHPRRRRRCCPTPPSGAA